MANIITGGAGATPVAGAKTLSELVSRWRSRLDDLAEPYLWSNQELTDYMNTMVNSLCREIPIIEDSTTADVCVLTVAPSTAIIQLSDRIVKVKRAKLDSDPSPLPFVNVDYMDQYYSDWEDATADDVQCVINDGIGSGKIRLYPPALTADTLRLSVVRLPLYDMVYASNLNDTLELQSRYTDLLDNGVMHYAYLKQDVDTYNLKKAEYHSALWRKDVEDIKRSMLKYGNSYTGTPLHEGNS